MDKKLPKDWKIKKLGEVCDKVTKGGTPTTYGYSFTQSGINFLKIENISNGRVNLENIKNFISEEAHNFQKKSILEENDLLFSIAGTIGEICLIKNDYLPSNTNQALAILRGYNKHLTPQFLTFQLNSSISQYVKLKARGGAMNNISLEDLKNVDLVIPPLQTQQAIVSKIEELFSELDKGIEDLKNAQQQLKTYRRSVLNLLVTDKNCMPIETIIDKLDQGWSPKCENEASNDNSEWAVIKTSAVQQGHFVEVQNKRLPKALKPRVQHELQIGDILITRAGPRVRVGICCMIKHTRPKLINCDKVYRIKVNKKIIIPEYFEFILNTPKYQDEIEKMKSGISDSGLNLTQKVFLQIIIPVPTIKEQHIIVQEIESRLSVADKMEESIAQSLQQAEALRQSILKKAFSGQLL